MVIFLTRLDSSKHDYYVGLYSNWIVYFSLGSI